MIRYSCHSENFGIFSAEETFSLIRTLGFDCVDVASRSLIPQSEIKKDVIGCAEYFYDLSQRFQLPLSELFLSDVWLEEQPVSPVSNMAQSAEFERCFNNICLFAKKAGFLSIMGSAGTPDAVLGFQKSFSRAAVTLKKQVDIATSHGIAFHVEPSRNSLLNTPDTALFMASVVPGLKYTLDFLHFHIQGIHQEESMKLLPYAGHIHARQAKTGIGKCNFSDGEIRYPEIVEEMKRLDWSGDIAMEFWCSQELLDAGIQAIEQNIVMRYYLKSLFESGKICMPLSTS